MTVSDEVRAQYKALKAQSDAAYQAAEPERNALDNKLEAWRVLEDQIEELLEGAEVESCEGCGDPIFEGDKRHTSSDGVFCVACAPTFEDLLQNPTGFWDTDENPLTPEAAKRIADRHVAAGGNLSDSMAS